jgi:tRNA pseudouridine13 synthase
MNHKKIRLRNLSGLSDKQNLQPIKNQVNESLTVISKTGFPNYFAYQRFGNKLANLQKSVDWLVKGFRTSRNKRSLYLSAVRSFLFNEILSNRVKNSTWNSIQACDRMQLNGKNSFFVLANDLENSAEVDEVAERLEQGDVHISGLLVGNDYAQLANESEIEVLQAHQDLVDLIIKKIDKSGTRAFRVIPEKLTWDFKGEDLTLTFYLPSGAYSTALLREVVDIQDMSLA